MARESLAGQLDLLLLSALSTQPAHGYAVIEELRRRSERRVRPAREHGLSGAASPRAGQAARERLGRGRRSPSPGVPADRQGPLGTCVRAGGSASRLRSGIGAAIGEAALIAMASTIVERYLLEFNDAACRRRRAARAHPRGGRRAACATPGVAGRRRPRIADEAQLDGGGAARPAGRGCGALRPPVRSVAPSERLVRGARMTHPWALPAAHWSRAGSRVTRGSTGLTVTRSSCASCCGRRSRAT